MHICILQRYNVSPRLMRLKKERNLSEEKKLRLVCCILKVYDICLHLWHLSDGFIKHENPSGRKLSRHYIRPEYVPCALDVTLGR